MPFQVLRGKKHAAIPYVLPGSNYIENALKKTEEGKTTVYRSSVYSFRMMDF